uniref:Secreted protein n=1 Tax=Peronospora matthiolae TaxID=2874970 RepID=A0AAV1UFX1_9STRA
MTRNGLQLFLVVLQVLYIWVNGSKQKEVAQARLLCTSLIPRRRRHGTGIITPVETYVRHDSLA